MPSFIWRRQRAWVAGVLMALAAGTVTAQSPAAIEVEGGWVRATIGGSKVTAAYFTLINRDETADRLLRVEVAPEAAARTMLHRTVIQDGIAKMEHARDVMLPPGASVAFAPGGLHVMLMGLARPLEEGDEFELTLVFERAAPRTVMLPVRRTPPLPAPPPTTVPPASGS